MVSLQIRMQESSEQVASRLGSEGCQLTQFTSDEWACNKAYIRQLLHLALSYYRGLSPRQHPGFKYLPLQSGSRLCGLHISKTTPCINLPLQSGCRLCSLVWASQCDCIPTSPYAPRAYTRNLTESHGELQCAALDSITFIF